MTKRRPSRVITVLAVGFLMLDGVLLLLAGLWSSTSALVGLGVVFCLAAAAVLFAWRRYQRQLGDLHQAIAARERALQDMQRDIERARNR